MGHSQSCQADPESSVGGLQRPLSGQKRTACRYCHSTDLVRFLSLGQQPPANSFIRAEDLAVERFYPLDVYWCRGCSLVQLVDVVPAELIFNEYVYLSSSSKALTAHYARLADMLTKRFARAGDVVVDIGCNDGILLRGYPRSLTVIGVEPSKAGALAEAEGFQVITAFFGAQTAHQIIQRHGRAKIVTATNVFAHVDDIGRFVEGIRMLLADDGVFVIEAPYLLDLIDQTLFDTIYHEHLCYLSLTPLVPFLARYDLEVFDVERVPFGASGPAIRLLIHAKGAGHPVGLSVQRLLTEEAAWGVGRLERYLGYAQQVEAIKSKLLALIHHLRDQGRRIGGYSAPAKGNTLLNYFGFTPALMECIAETNPLKQHLLTPGAHIPVVSEEEFLAQMPDYAVLLSWNYLEHFLQHSEYVKRGGRFIVPLPVPSIAP